MLIDAVNYLTPDVLEDPNPLMQLVPLTNTTENIFLPLVFSERHWPHAGWMNQIILIICQSEVQLTK